MNAAIYTDNYFEQQQIAEALKRCGMEFLHPVRITFFSDYSAFCRSLTDCRLDLIVIAQNGTFSLELLDTVQRLTPRTPLMWFSDLDFAVRSYDYGVVWFGKKPVELPALRKAFERLLRVKMQLKMTQSAPND